MIGRRRPGARAILGWVAVAVALLAGRVAAQTNQLGEAFDRSTRGDSLAILALLNRGEPDSAHAHLARIVPAARASGDSARVGRALLLEAVIALRRSRPTEAMSRIDQARRLALQTGDVATFMATLRAESIVHNMNGDYARTEPLIARWTVLAKQLNNPEYLGWGATTRAFLARVRGDIPAARAQLLIAEAIFDSLDNPVGRAYVANDLGRLDIHVGDYAAARAAYEKTLAIVGTDGDPRIRDWALANLGVCEIRAGDPVRGLALYEQSLAGKKLRGESVETLVTYSNIVTTATDLGRIDDALRLGQDALALALRESVLVEIPWARFNLGSALWAADRQAAAIVEWRQVLADPRSEPALFAMSMGGIANALAEGDSLLAAARLYDEALARYGAAIPAESRIKLSIDLARVHLRAGQAVLVPPRLEPMAREADRGSDEELGAITWGLLAEAYRKLGRHGDAARALANADARWEAGRDAASTFEFREHRGEQARALLVETAVTGEPDAAFARLQRYKTRTLLERLSRPNAPVAAPAGQDSAQFAAAAFRSTTLRAGEVFLEFALGPDTTLLFVVTRDGVRRVGLPGERTLAPQVKLAHEAFATRPGTGEARGSSATAARVAAQALGRTLLGPAAVEIAAAKTVLVAPDGVLHRVPFGALIVGGGETPLGASHRVAIEPSAAFLATVRGRTAQAAAAARKSGLLAVGGGRREATDSGRGLEGAREEIENLSARFSGVTARYAGDDGRVALAIGDFAPFSGLHFAGHSEADDQLPWRSGIVLGPATRGGDSLLTAGELAAAPIGARLVVLSSCESAGGRVRVGEGVAGLTTAFLAAGAPSVVATLWPVDDRVTVRLMDRFYAGLSSGRDAADALRAAQQELRANAESSHPFYWAGFVLVGEPETAFPLEARGGPASVTGVAITALLVAIVALLVWRGRRRGHSPPASA